MLGHLDFKGREQNAVGIVGTNLVHRRLKAQVMQKLVWKKRSHSLDAPEGPLVDYLAPFERLLPNRDTHPTRFDDACSSSPISVNG